MREVHRLGDHPAAHDADGYALVPSAGHAVRIMVRSARSGKRCPPAQGAAFVNS
jgi:hypothetical protein